MKWYENVVNVCMGIQPGEKVLLITDSLLTKEQEQLAQTIHAVENVELRRWTLPDAERPLKVAPPEILECARTFNAGMQFLGHTTNEELPYRFSLIQATNEGGTMRFASGLNIDQAILDNELMADYKEIASITEKLHHRLNGRSEVRITSPLGTDLTMSIKGRIVATDPGILREPGFHNLPSGECYVAPIETSANGLFVVDKSFPEIVIKEPIRITFKDGRIVNIAGGEEAAKLEATIAAAEKKPNGEGSRVIAELGIGTNPYARITGNVMTDEKVMGTIHIAIGHNAVPPYNGQNTAPIHLDGTMGQPTLVIDGETLIDNGKYLV
jgi:leucyl aminopeptidase (aminopeptidase T)